MVSKRLTISVPERLVEPIKAECEKRGMSVSYACVAALISYLKLECPTCGQFHTGETDDSRSKTDVSMVTPSSSSSSSSSS